MNPFFIDICKVQPSQLFLSNDKIMRLQQTFSPLAFALHTPLPVKKLDDKIIFTDSHTRAYLYWQANIKEIPVYWDDDPLHYDLYKLCVDWCLSEKIFHVGHLQHRILPHSQYEVQWIQRCINAERSMPNYTLF
ncbi:hypothetical protein [Bacillus cereus group sp. BfR-BA-01380]|uniref:hypothetical protein n=1 Tax=Bacillus cereus group sp. BfR-BA-01380 TaxID=2920324 RepID=UPI001F57CB15|nr:hypothetical protein [Bacillus cereus group sp. BfR-BA-01380]